MSATSETPPGEHEPEPRPGFLRPGVLMGICAILGLVILLRTFVLEVYIVVGDSMAPGLMDREHLLICKLTGVVGIAPADIVVFTHADTPRRPLIKRVIALPGDIVRISAGRVFVNERELGESYLPAAERDPTSNASDTKVPADCLYVLGDNRPNSRDSRTFGAIPSDRVIGRAILRVWPLSRIRGL